MALAMIALTIIAMVMLYIGSQAMSGLLTSKQKSERSVGMAAGDSGIQWYRLALETRLVSEADSFTLTRDDMQLLARRGGSGNCAEGPCLLPEGQNPPGLTRSPFLESSERAIMRMPQGDQIHYWEVYRTIPPYYAARQANDLVVYIRAWSTSNDARPKATSKPRIFRVQFRPGYASDYQSLTDGPFFVEGNDNFVINGPIHSNGFQTSSWLAVRNGENHTGIFFDQNSTPRCGDQARFSTAQGVDGTARIHIPNDSRCRQPHRAASKNAKQIPLTGAERAIDFARLNSRNVRNQRTTIYHVQGERANQPHVVDLDSSRFGFITVDGNRRFPIEGFRARPNERQTSGDSENLTLLVDGDVRVRGQLRGRNGVVRRVTIMNQRSSANSARSPRVYLEASDASGVVGAAKPNQDAVGIISPGDVVLRGGPDPTIRDSARCLREVNLAAMSQAGSITFTPELITPARPAADLASYFCPRQLVLNGSFVAHGQLTTSLRWDDGGRVGYPNLKFDFNRRLISNPPPNYATTAPWEVTEAQDANARCLDPFTTQGRNPKCR